MLVEPGAVMTGMLDRASATAKAVLARKPRTRYTVGRDAAVITRLARILPAVT